MSFLFRRGRVRTSLVALFLLLGVCGAAFGQQDPLSGRNGFPQFRNLSGLAGGGFGVDSDGYGALSGATALSTPIAYVLGHDQFRFLAGKMSYNHGLNFGNRKSNGTGVVMYGHTFGQFNIAVSDVLLSSALDQAINVQAQWIPRPGDRLSYSLGIQDIFGTAGSAGQGFPTDGQTSLSVFGVATYRVGFRDHPLYISAGAGTRRFRQAFASGSLQILNPVRTWLEWDGYGFNGGFLFTLRTNPGRRSPELFSTVGVVRGKYLMLSAGFGF